VKVTPEYPGDNPEKRAARVFLYKMGLTAPKGGHALTLAGHQPEDEVELMRDYLKWNGKQTWFVDKSTKANVVAAMNRIEKDWSEAQVYRGDLKKLLRFIYPISFAHLDFMGYLNDKSVIPCLKEVSERCLPRAIIGLTWYRGRERPDLHTSAKRLVKASGGMSDPMWRWKGAINIVSEITDGRLQFASGIEYHNHRSPMSLTVFRAT
jgi:hypothetical protein